MTIENILKTVYDPSYWQKTAVTCFVGQHFPYQFMRKVLHALELEKTIGLPRSRIQFSTQDSKTLLPLLQQTILGQASFFWLGDVEEGFITKNRDALLAGLQNYAGENRIALFVQELSPKIKLPVIQLPTDITPQEGMMLAQLFAPKTLANDYKRKALQALLAQQQGLNLNLFITILDSIELVQVKQLPDFMRYLTPLLPLNAELSLLSQTFFKRDPHFFKTWSTICDQYPPVFWLAFWQDQWWRAFHVITFAKQKNIILAKKMGSKLPYSFISRDWQNYQPEYFQNLLAQLYAIDYALKRGHLFCSFDFLYAQHFAPNKNKGSW